MHAFAAAGTSFLLAVLWFDLMFDVQTRGHRGALLPDHVLTSISTYYRRVTTEAAPMSRLVALVMLATLAVVAAEVVTGAISPWLAWPSLAAAASAVGLAAGRTVRNAVRLGRATEPPDAQTRLARTIYRDHVYCFAAMAVVLVLQLCAPT